MSVALDAEALAPRPESPFRTIRENRFLELAEHTAVGADVPHTLYSLAGLAMTGVVAGIGSGDPAAATQLATALPLTALGTSVLAAPALLALIPFQDMAMDGRAAVLAMAAAVARAGRLAWGLLPTLVFAVAATEVGVEVFLAIAMALGLATTRALHRELVGAEARAALSAVGDEPVPVHQLNTRELLLAVWCALHAAVGLRLLIANLSF